MEERARSNGFNEPIVKVEEDEDNELVFDDTSEFIRSVQYDPIVVKPEPKAEPAHLKAEPSDDVDMRDAEEAREPEPGEVDMKEEEDEESMLHALQRAMDAAESDEADVKKENGDFVVGTSAAQTHSTGLASTLNILRQQGILSSRADDLEEREKTQRRRDLWLAEYRTQQALKELERVKSKGEKRDQAQREYENRLREQREARDAMNLFKDYKPDVNIVYHDEFGRTLTPKEAWKALSHRFHGKGSGKMKTEKRLKKIAEEKKREAMISGDTPLSMNRAFQARQEKAGQAHFVLSVGNRG